MLSINTYAQEHVDECCAKVAAQVAAYETLLATAKQQSASGEPRLNAAIETFEPIFFGNLVVALENHFVHRARAIEKKGTATRSMRCAR